MSQKYEVRLLESLLVVNKESLHCEMIEGVVEMLRPQLEKWKGIAEKAHPYTPPMAYGSCPSFVGRAVAGYCDSWLLRGMKKEMESMGWDFKHVYCVGDGDSLMVVFEVGLQPRAWNRTAIGSSGATIMTASEVGD